MKEITQEMREIESIYSYTLISYITAQLWIYEMYRRIRWQNYIFLKR